MQHHGVPARLVDVTSDPVTALWFATEEHRPDASGQVRQSKGVFRRRCNRYGVVLNF
ncbi:FRG domain-containing protein [Amycolatopsis sp. NPDC058986]|uniref:FRG domain-containing protein n=1 Tax=unclassified Amycolatopsis TaxID=2618356 RepID=UPI00366AF0C4